MLAAALLLFPAILWEPPYAVEREGAVWQVKKPGWSVFRAASPAPAWVLFESARRPTAEQRRSAMPRLRLARRLVRFNPATQARTAIADWSAEPDARQIEADIQTLIDRFAPEAGARLSRTPLFLARLYAASGHTAEEPHDSRRFVIYLDPFRATGRLHAASTLVHELAHVERYEARGFHANRAAAVLPRDDFVLLGLADELAGYRAEAAFLEAYLASLGAAERRSLREAMPAAQLRWPAALTALLAGREKEAREQVILDVHRQAARYWETHRGGRLDPALEASIQNWYSRSQEWQEIAAQRRDYGLAN